MSRKAHSALSYVKKNIEVKRVGEISHFSTEASKAFFSW